MRLQYNSPVILTFALICTAAMIFASLTGDASTRAFFVVYPGIGQFLNPLTYFRIFTHVIGHADWGHLIGNFSLILLIGPLLEEKYGSKSILIKIIITAGVTGLLNTLFFSSALLGASGVVFMLILLSSFSNIRAGEIPITFIIVAALYLGKEIIDGLRSDNVSQFAHILGGLVGSLFGFQKLLPPTNLMK
jgi:membrane associated rhomboid family serine protease